MWSGTVGLVNCQHKYLTAETFGFKINANGTGLKKKQQFSIEPFPLSYDGHLNGNKLSEDFDELEHVAIKSHLNCYLAVDSYGNVTCDSTELTEGARFTITICSLSSSQRQGGQDEEQISWAFRNISRGYYLGCTSDGTIICNAKMPQSKTELWNVHLIPARGASIFALKSIGRKRYARTMDSSSNGINQFIRNNLNDESSDQVQVDALIPWGQETLFQFKYFDAGKYALLTSNSKYLTFDGQCIDDISNGANGNANANGSNGAKVLFSGPNINLKKECLFTVEYHGGNIAFRDFAGRYLAAAGRASVLRTRATTVSRDELFIFEPAPIQLALRATFNDRWASIKQGVEVSANQNEITSKYETFSFEYNDATSSWNIATQDGYFWSLGGGTTIQIDKNSKDGKSKANFKIKWLEDGTCSLLVNSNDDPTLKWICAKKSGQLYTASNGDSSVKFYLKIQNRTFLNLRAKNGSGFVGIKSPIGQQQQLNGKLESNKTTPDSIKIEYANSDNLDVDGGDGHDGVLKINCCYLKMTSNNKYLSLIDGNSVAADASSLACAQQWQLELRTGTFMAIRTIESSSYLNLTGNGSVQVNACSPDQATLWEF